MPIPDDLTSLPLADMILRAMSDPAAIVPRERHSGRLERMADWRARAVWEALSECGIDPARTFVSEHAMRAFDDADGDAVEAAAQRGADRLAFVTAEPGRRDNIHARALTEGRDGDS